MLIVIAHYNARLQSYEPLDDLSFRVVTKDASGQRLPYGGLKLVAVLSEKHGERETPVVDNGDGTYDVNVQASESGLAQVKLLMAGTGHLLTKRQVTTSAQSACPHFWRMLSAGASYGRTGAATSFFLRPVDCNGGNVDSGIDVSSAASLQGRLSVTLLGPYGIPLTSDGLLRLEPFADAPAGVQALDDGSLRVNYYSDVCGASEISVKVDGQDVAGSPRRLTFVDATGAGSCGCPAPVALPASIGGETGFCGGHGVCVDSTCVCESGYSGNACETAPAPRIASARFSPTGDAIHIEFDQAVRRTDDVSFDFWFQKVFCLTQLYFARLPLDRALVAVIWCEATLVKTRPVCRQVQLD